MRRLLIAAFAAAVLLPGTVLAKGEAIGLWMEGRVSEVRVEGRDIRLVLTGRFWFDQYRGQEAAVVEVRDPRTGGAATIPAVLTQGRPFFAMTENWRGGALRKSGALLEILQAAAGSGKVVRLELADSRLSFGRGGTLAVERATVRRATDHALR
jgi:hypothetical protein